jgi:hypothetical protein
MIIDRLSAYEFLNAHELKSLKLRRVEYDRKEKYARPEFVCECGATELLELRPGYGECRKCKMPYILEDDRHNRTRGG